MYAMSEENQVEKSPATPLSVKILIALAFLQVSATGALGFMVYNLSIGAANPVAAIAPEEVTAPKVDPEYMDIGPITVNLRTDGAGQHLLYTRMKLKLADKETLDFLESKRDEIHNELLVLLSGRDAAVLASAPGKKTVADDITALIHDYFADDRPQLSIKGVLFQDFIVQ